MSERAVVLIDGGYLNKILPALLPGRKIDYEKFSDMVCGNCERLRTYYYNCMPYQSSPVTPEESEKYSKMNQFIRRLEQLSRFQIKLGRLQKYYNETGDVVYKQKRMDVLLAVDMAQLSWSRNISTAILVAGDSDFVPVVQTAKDAGVLVKLYYSDIAVHDELLTSADDKIKITPEMLEKVALRKFI
ncbi:NYN domain-containing protein [Methanoregula sp.]|uniref:NYN domain-containing protein n=1 Tax=Methanoregula sp. TaxID=2052170 RepID=UPI003C729FA2